MRLVETGRDWLTLVSTVFDGFRPVITGFLLAFYWFRLVSTARDWSRLVVSGRGWFRLVSTGLDRFRMVFTGLDWFRLVETGRDW